MSERSRQYLESAALTDRDATQVAEAQAALLGELPGGFPVEVRRRLKRGDIWWAELPSPVGSRPVVILTRDAVLENLGAIVVALVTQTVPLDRPK